MQNPKFETIAKRYAELNIYSDKFNPLLALKSPAVHITIPQWKAPIYYSVDEFERTMLWKKMLREEQQKRQQ